MLSQFDFFQSSINQRGQVQNRQSQIVAQQAQNELEIAQARHAAFQLFNASIAALEETLDNKPNVHSVFRDLIYKAKIIARVEDSERIISLTQIIDWANQSYQRPYEPGQREPYKPAPDLINVLLSEISNASVMDRTYVKNAVGVLGILISVAYAALSFFILSNYEFPLGLLIIFGNILGFSSLLLLTMSIAMMKAPPSSVGFEVRQLSEMFQVPAEQNDNLNSAALVAP